jgi:MFS family permease
MEAVKREPYVPTPSMYSLANEFGDYRCAKEKMELDFVITMMYVGTVVGFLGLTLAGDLVGRKLLMVVCLGINVVGLLLVIFCANIEMAAFGLFLSTVGIQNAFNVCFYFLSETVAESHREKFSVAIQLFYGLGVLSNVGWYYFVGDWQLIMALFYFAPSVIVTAAVVFFVRDTPICLVTRNSPTKALLAFKHIAKFNKVESLHLTVEEIDNIKEAYSQSSNERGGSQKQSRFSVVDLFRFKSLRGMTLMLILLQCTIIFEFYAPALMLDAFQLNIFINGLVVGVSEIIAYPICFYLIMRTRRQTVAYVCFAANFLCSVLLIFLWDQGSEQAPDIGSSIGVLLLIFVFRFAISVEYTFFYVYFNELYPTQVRVLGTGLVSLSGGIMVTVAPELIDSCIQGGFPVMILFAVLSAASCFFSYKLPETFQKTPPDVVEELRDGFNEEASLLEADGFNDPQLKDGKSTNYSDPPNDE